jgi:alkylation response protein AidB-like acyl-CoA dehydrogenase
MTERARWNDEELVAFEAGLTSDNLSAIMRSTWTWDDRALRRDLARLMTMLRAVRELDQVGVTHRLVRGRTLQAASVFLAAVLGPRVIADSGHATSYSFSDTLIRSPWLTGGPEEERLLRAIGAQAEQAVKGPVESGVSSAPTFASQALAAHALAASGDQGAGAEYLSKIEAGSLTATLAAAEAPGSWDPALVRTRASLEGSQWFLEGEKYFVPDADSADVLFVVARSAAGPSLFAVEAAAPGLTVSGMQAIDPTRPLARLELRQVPAVLIGIEGAGGRLMGRVLDLATVSLAEEQVKSARRCLELGVAVANAADWPHGAASRLYGELWAQVEVAEAMWERARRLAPADTTEGSIAAAMAHISCSETFTSVARGALQLVGEADDASTHELTGLFLRAQSSDLLFGGPALYYERLLERMGV